jgi:UDP-3-O-[3-hydroxymyristoyl] glucosamine N-acyltransferase
MGMRLDELARQIDAQFTGDGSVEVNSVAPLDRAEPGQVGFLTNSRYAGDLETTRASAVIAGSNTKSQHVPLLLSADPQFAYARAMALLHGYRRHGHAGVHPQAHVEKSAAIGDGTIVYPGAYIGAEVQVGRDCVIHPNVCIYEQCVIGNRVIIHAGTCIGSDGFGYAYHQGVHHKIPQIGNVVVEDDVEIGSNCTIARGALDSTFIGAGTKIDGQVMIGHGARIGKGCIIVAQVGIAGSVEIGNYVTLAGQAGVAGHLKIGDRARVGAQAGVMFDVEAGADVHGSPAMPAQQARRAYFLLGKLPELAQRIKQLEEQVQDLSDSGDTPIA